MAFPTDPGRTEELKFVRALAQWLDDRRDAGAFDRVAIVAPPRMLGDLRGEISDAVKTCVYNELGKDLVNTPGNEIVGHFKAHDLVR